MREMAAFERKPDGVFQELNNLHLKLGNRYRLLRLSAIIKSKACPRLPL